MQELRVESGGVGIHVVDWRGLEEQRQILLCIHGITANARAFDGIAAALGPEIGVIALDLRGRGESDKPDGPYDIPTHVEDVVAVLDALALDAVAVAGWSLGALIGMRLAAQHSERVHHLILLDPPLVPLSDAARESFGRVQGRLANTYPDLATAIETLRASPALAGQWNAAIETFVVADVEEMPDGTVRHRMSADVLRKEYEALVTPLTTLIPKIACPVLLLRATDPLVRPGDELLSSADAQRAVRLFAHGKTLDVPGTNHYTIVLGPPEGTVVAMRAFLSLPNSAE